MNVSPYERLRDLSVLVVEDSYFVAVALTQHLRELGCRVVGPAPSVQAAMNLLDRETCDAAILDINLGTETAEPVAAALAARHTPFFFVTGYSSPRLLGSIYESHARLLKPVSSDSLRDALVAAVGR